MNKVLLVVCALLVLVFVSRAVIVAAQENAQSNSMAEMENSDFMKEFKAEIAASNILDPETLQELNALAQQLNEATFNMELNVEANASVEAAQ
jgi:hypothetical protein